MFNFGGNENEAVRPTNYNDLGFYYTVYDILNTVNTSRTRFHLRKLLNGW